MIWIALLVVSVIFNVYFGMLAFVQSVEMGNMLLALEEEENGK